MTEPVSLEQIKADLRLDPGETDQDVTLQGLIVAARRVVELKTSRTLVGNAPTLVGDDAILACQAISLLAGTWYANPEAVMADARSTATELPLSVSWIITSLKKWDDGE